MCRTRIKTTQVQRVTNYACMHFIGNLPTTTSSKTRTRNRRQEDRMSHGDSRPLSSTPILSHSRPLQISHQAIIHQLRAVPTRFTTAKQQATSIPRAWAFTSERHCPFPLLKVLSMLDLPSRWTPSISRCSNRTISRTRIPLHPSSLMPRVHLSIKTRATRQSIRLTDRQWATSAWIAISMGSLMVCLCLLASSTVASQHRRLNYLESELKPRPPYGPLAQCSA